MSYKKLGQYIQQITIKNTDLAVETLLGVSVQKIFIPSIANTVGTDFKKYKIVKKGQFTYIPDTSRRGDKIGVALLKDHEEGLVSNVYTVFEVIDHSLLIPEYLMMWFTRPEFDRYARFKSHGSVREPFTWEDMCNVELPVPDIEKQKAIVKAYQVVTDRIALKEKISGKLEMQIQIMLENFLIKNREFSKLEKLESSISSATTGADAIQKVPIVSYDTGLKCARVGDITNKRTPTNWAFSLATPEIVNRYKLEKNNILVTRTATLGISQFIQVNENVVYNNGLIRLKVDEEKATPLFIFWMLNTPTFHQYISRINNDTSVRPNMKIDYLLKYEFYLPEHIKQVEFTKQASVMQKNIFLNNDEILKLQSLQSLLLSRLATE